MSRKSDFTDGEYRIEADYGRLCMTMLNDITGMHIVLEEVIDDVCDGKEMSAGVKLRELYAAMGERIDSYHRTIGDNGNAKG